MVITSNRLAAATTEPATLALRAYNLAVEHDAAAEHECAANDCTGCRGRVPTETNISTGRRMHLGVGHVMVCTAPAWSPPIAAAAKTWDVVGPMSTSLHRRIVKVGDAIAIAARLDLATQPHAHRVVAS